MDTHDPELIRKANSLYWESDAGVNVIADELDLSKGALYALIEPLDAGVSCPECASALEFSNRTALEKGLVSCPGCGLEEEYELVEAMALSEAVSPPLTVVDGASDSASGSTAGTEPTSQAARAVEALRSGGRQLAEDISEISGTKVPVRTLVGSTLLALAAGIAIGQITGRR